MSDSGWILISHILTNPTPSFVSRGDMILGIVLLRPTDWPCTMIVCCTGCWSFLGLGLGLGLTLTLGEVNVGLVDRCNDRHTAF